MEQTFLTINQARWEGIKKKKRLTEIALLEAGTVKAYQCALQNKDCKTQTQMYINALTNLV